jgi:hypothetical protein
MVGLVFFSQGLTVAGNQTCRLAKHQVCFQDVLRSGGRGSFLL